MEASVWRPWARSGEVVEFVDGEAGVLDDPGECVFLDGSMGGDYQLDDVFSSSFLETDVTTLLPYHYEPSLVQGVDHSAGRKGWALWSYGYFLDQVAVADKKFIIHRFEIELDGFFYAGQGFVLGLAFADTTGEGWCVNSKAFLV